MAREPFQESDVHRACRARAPFWTGRIVAAAILLAALATTGDARADGISHSAQARHSVVAAALKTEVPPQLALAVARVGGVPFTRRGDNRAVVGIMGIRPSLAREEFGVGPYQLRETGANAGLGVALLERLHRRHDGRWDLALSHYRGGPLERCGNESVVHLDTIDYVASVMEWWRTYQDDESVAALVDRIREGGFRRERFTRGRFPVDDNTFLSASAGEGLYDEEWFFSREESSAMSGGTWIAVVDGATRFRTDGRVPFRTVRPERFF